jgi:predicted short-subunit dehydrogenase-like oxidoreductase (DUF2520 family)
VKRAADGERADCAIAGGGRAGAALAAALVRRGATVRIWDRDARRAARVARATGARRADSLAELAHGARVVVLAVSDDAVPAVARALARAWPRPGAAPAAPCAALHLAGALPSAALQPLAARGAATGVCQPAVALHGAASAAALEGAFATVSGADAAGRRAAAALARAAGLRPVAVDDARRPLAHLGMVLAAGDAVALLAEAAGLLERAGVRPAVARAIAARLGEGSARAFAAGGGERALTGPAARGDVRTLSRHRAALEAAGLAGSDAAAAHRALARAGAGRAARAGDLTRAAHARVLAALGGWTRRRRSRTLPGGGHRP